MVLAELEKLGCRLIARNHRISGVEIDLILQAPQDEIWLIEVKSFSDVQYIDRRVTPSQMRRIRFVLRILLEKGEKARAHLALVHQERIDLRRDFFVQDL